MCQLKIISFVEAGKGFEAKENKRGGNNQPNKERTTNICKSYTEQSVV